MKRYAAKLLFQYRVRVRGDDGKRRTCEERIVLFDAASAREALRLAKRHGKSAQFSALNSCGNRYYFEFVGIMDLLHLGEECSQGEVWYDITKRLMPMERKQEILPAESDLNAIRWETKEPEQPSTGIRE